MQNRYLFWFCVSYIATAFISAVFESVLAVCSLIVLFVAGLGFYLVRKGGRISAALVVIAVAFSLVWQAFSFSRDIIDKSLLNGEATIVAEVSSFAEKTSSGGTSFLVKLEDEAETTLRVYAAASGENLVPGDIVRMTLDVYEFENSEFFAEKTYYKSRHTDARAFASALEVVGHSKERKLRYFPEYLSKKVEERIYSLFEKENAAFLNSLILGKKNALDKDFKKDLSRVGMSHVVSVSGLHISFIVGFLVIFTKNRYLKLFAIPFMFLFALMVGAPQSALRAVIMQTLVILSSVKKREYDSLTSIAFAAFILVFLNPYCVTDLAFLLSFSATLGIILLYRPLFGALCVRKDTLPHIVRRTINSVVVTFCVTVSALIFTAPIAVFGFDAVSLIAPLSNVLLSPFIMLAFVGGLVVLALSFILLPIGKGAAFVLDFLINFIIRMVKMLSKIPFAEVFADGSVALMMVLFICFVVAYAILAGRKKIRVRFALLMILLASGTAFFVGLVPKFEDRGGIRFDVLDVGQGQCIVATCGDECVVIDCGGNENAEDVAALHLLKNGIKDIDALVLTHAHADHAGGALYLVETFETKDVYMPATDKDNATFIRVADEVRKHGEAVFVEEDTMFSLSDMEISILTLPEGRGQNENGLVVIIRDEEYEILITGDIPSKLEKTIIEKIPDCESYVMGHHGSDTSSSLALLNKALPELCVVSVGEGNAYGHPSAEVLARVKGLGADLHRTDLEGSITFYSR